MAWDVRSASSWKAVWTDSVYITYVSITRVKIPADLRRTTNCPHTFHSVDELTQIICSKLPRAHTGIEMVYGEPAHPGSETLVQPKLTPPVHGDEVTKPLVSELVGYNISDAVSIAVCRSLGVEQNCGRAAICQFKIQR